MSKFFIQELPMNEINYISVPIHVLVGVPAREFSDESLFDRGLGLVGRLLRGKVRRESL